MRPPPPHQTIQDPLANPCGLRVGPDRCPNDDHEGAIVRIESQDGAHAPNRKSNHRVLTYLPGRLLHRAAFYRSGRPSAEGPASYCSEAVFGSEAGGGYRSEAVFGRRAGEGAALGRPYRSKAASAQGKEQQQGARSRCCWLGKLAVGAGQLCYQSKGGSQYPGSSGGELVAAFVKERPDETTALLFASLALNCCKGKYAFAHAHLQI